MWNFHSRIFITGDKNRLKLYKSYFKYYCRYHLYLKCPETKPSPSFYFKTLAQEVWIASLIFFITLTVTIWSTTKFFRSHKIAETDSSLYGCFMSVIAGFINQSKWKVKLITNLLKLYSYFRFWFETKTYSK